MNIFARITATLVSVCCVVACGGRSALPVANSSAIPGSLSNLNSISFADAVAQGYVTTTCPTPSPGEVTCTTANFTDAGLAALGLLPTSLSTQSSTRRHSLSSGGYYSIAQILSAYGLTSLSASGGKGMTVAIVGVGDDPSLENDLGVFRSTYNLPPCTSAAGCFKKVAEDGSNSLTAMSDLQWHSEYANDVDTVSAICPNCKILIVESNSRQVADMAASENTAATFHPISIDNSYAAVESASTAQYASAYNHPGIAVTAAAGGSYVIGASFPATFSTVIAVGATSLVPDSTVARGWVDNIYPWGNVGCSQFIAKPSWQTDTGCSMRTISDVSFEGDPSTRFQDYDNGTWKSGGWTSGATAAIAAIYALIGTPANDASALYRGSAGLNRVTGGSLTSGHGGPPNAAGQCPIGTSTADGVVYEQSALTHRGALSSSSTLPGYFCTAQQCYSAPGGNGTPNGSAVLNGSGPLSPCVPTTPTPVPTATNCILPSPEPSPTGLVHPTQAPSGTPCTS